MPLLRSGPGRNPRRPRDDTARSVAAPASPPGRDRERTAPRRRKPSRSAETGNAARSPAKRSPGRSGSAGSGGRRAIASASAPPPATAALAGDPREALCHVVAKPIEGTCQRCQPCDDHIIVTWCGLAGEHSPSRLTKTATRTVAGHGFTNPPARRKPQTHLVARAWPGASLDHECRRHPALAGGGDREELGTPFQADYARSRPPRLGAGTVLADAQLDRRFRPLARRRAITRRPPTVAMRARKPCRRLRTMLLGWKVRFTTASVSSGQTASPYRRAPPACQTPVMPGRR